MDLDDAGSRARFLIRDRDGKFPACSMLDRALIWNQAHLLHALREFEQFYNAHSPHHANRQPPATTRAAPADPGTGRRHPP